MGNTIKYAREQANPRPTMHDKGIEFEIKVRIMDNGIIMVNENPCSEPDASLKASRFMAQMLEEVRKMHWARQEAKRQSRSNAMAVS
jgi:hypothetical protein